MDVVFTVDGRERGARKFDVTKAYANDAVTGAQIEVTDPLHPAIKLEKNLMSAWLIHVVGCFVEKSTIKEALSVNIQSFKHYCTILQGLLPSGFDKMPLDSFAQYQWNIKGENKRTFLEFPKNMKHGRWLSKAIAPVGAWEKQQKINASDSETALRYVDADGNVHPFTRNGWFMNSNFATMQKEETSPGASQMNAGSSANSTTADGW